MQDIVAAEKRHFEHNACAVCAAPGRRSVEVRPGTGKINQPAVRRGPVFGRRSAVIRDIGVAERMQYLMSRAVQIDAENDPFSVCAARRGRPHHIAVSGKERPGRLCAIEIRAAAVRGEGVDHREPAAVGIEAEDDAAAARPALPGRAVESSVVIALHQCGGRPHPLRVDAVAVRRRERMDDGFAGSVRVDLKHRAGVCSRPL